MPAQNRHYRAALQPLLDRACALHGYERRLWLEELRSDCPVVTRDLERLLCELQSDAPAHSRRDTDAPVPRPDSLRALGLRG